MNIIEGWPKQTVKSYQAWLIDSETGEKRDVTPSRYQIPESGDGIKSMRKAP